MRQSLTATPKTILVDVCVKYIFYQMLQLNTNDKLATVLKPSIDKSAPSPLHPTALSGEDTNPPSGDLLLLSGRGHYGNAQ